MDIVWIIPDRRTFATASIGTVNGDLVFEIYCRQGAGRCHYLLHHVKYGYVYSSLRTGVFAVDDQRYCSSIDEAKERAERYLNLMIIR